MATMATEDVSIQGLTLRLHRLSAERREGTSPRTLLLLHGFLDAGGTWDLVAPTLAKAGYDIVAPDLRGFGKSGRLGAGGYYHFSDYIRDIDELTDRLAAPWLGIVGHSMGGTVASLYTGTRPERVKALAILEGLGPLAEPVELAPGRMRKWLADLTRLGRTPRPMASEAEALERLAATHPRIPREILATRVPLLTGTSNGQLVWRYDPMHRSTSPMPFHLEVFHAFLSAITCPVLHVGGGPAGWHPPDEEVRLAAIAHLERFELPEAGHMMHWTNPDALAERLVTFFGAS